MDWSPRHVRRQARYIEDARRELHLRREMTADKPRPADEPAVSLVELRQMLDDLRILNIGALHGEPTDSQSGKAATGPCAGTGEQDTFLLCVREDVKILTASSLMNLDAKSRLVLSLYYLEELTMKEVGMVLDVSESSALQTHSVALGLLLLQVENMLSARARTSRDSAFSNIDPRFPRNQPS